MRNKNKRMLQNRKPVSLYTLPIFQLAIKKIKIKINSKTNESINKIVQIETSHIE